MSDTQGGGPSGNPLVADPGNQPFSGGWSNLISNPTGDWGSGAGLFDDIGLTAKDLAQGNWVDAGVDAAGGALDLLALVEDPLGGLAAAGVGWLIDHISFLSWPFDVLAGSPGQIQAMSTTWTNISAALNQGANDYTASVNSLRGNWKGSAADAYFSAANNFAISLSSAGSAASLAATGFTLTGILAATIRGIIRDDIATFVGQLIEKAIITAAAAWIPGAMELLIIDTVFESYRLAFVNIQRLHKLAGQVSDIARKCRSAIQKFEANHTALTNAAHYLNGQAAYGAPGKKFYAPTQANVYRNVAKGTTQQGRDGQAAKTISIDDGALTNNDFKTDG